MHDSEAKVWKTTIVNYFSSGVYLSYFCFPKHYFVFVLYYFQSLPSCSAVTKGFPLRGSIKCYLILMVFTCRKEGRYTNYQSGDEAQKGEGPFFPIKQLT